MIMSIYLLSEVIKTDPDFEVGEEPAEERLWIL
jgi:hypothetical protein